MAYKRKSATKRRSSSSRSRSTSRTSARRRTTTSARRSTRAPAIRLVIESAAPKPASITQANMVERKRSRTL